MSDITIKIIEKVNIITNLFLFLKKHPDRIPNNGYSVSNGKRNGINALPVNIVTISNKSTGIKIIQNWLGVFFGFTNKSVKTK
ncbi:hypothetical protein [Pedobacter sp. UC225_61]|uniref:hypothetical protein n=1 Tax=Pedobacter sp. UC225_61 TaxID=3374623 RepID=UPI0037C984E0